MNLIAALSLNGAIGKGGSLPWHHREDLRHFRRVTLGHTVIMGRKTYESIGKPLPGRVNIVLTSSQVEASTTDLHFCTSWESALEKAESIQEKARGRLFRLGKEIFCIGGRSVYELALPRASKFYLTEVLSKVDGDVFFPEWNRSDWREVESKLSECGNLRFTELWRKS